MTVEDFSANIGEESFNENGQSEAGIGDATSSASEAAIEDKTFSIPQSLSATEGIFWDEILVSVIVIIASIAIYFIIRYFLNRAADSLGLERGQLKGIFSITKLTLIVIAIIVVIFQFSSLSGVAAGAISVAAGTIIGFSSRNTISNAIAGILLLSSRPFKIGDRIRTSVNDDLIGDVIEITILYTKLRTIRNELVAIPNQMLLQQQIINYSGLDILACTVDVSLTYDHSRKRIEALLLEAANKTNEIISDPTPLVLLKRFDSYAAVYELRAYTNKPNEFLKIQSEIRKNVYELFQMNGLDLTVPQAQSNIDTAPQKREDFDFDKERIK
ncbi:MAG: mechanosensitive ion channel family protein [Thermoproteota archaeon]|nr:mechanosensitive ion channel family protein [Thermoproteota archaeon]